RRLEPLNVSGGLRTTFIAAAAISVAVLGWYIGRRRAAPDAASLSFYIDAKQCQACHAAIHRTYQHVGMARSFAPTPHASPIEDYERRNHFFHARSGRHYQMFRRDGRFLQRRYE